MDQARGPRANQLAKGVARNQSVVLALPTSGCVNQGPAPETVRRSASLSEVSLAYRAGPGSPSGAASRCKPSSISSSPTRRRSWVVFYSLGEGADKGVYYDAHPIKHMSHHLTMLAYDMNDQPLSFGHGAPLRLRNEIELGFKQVKWIRGIEFVAHFSEIGSGYGGYNQDHEFFGYRQSI
jgi:molybdopterin-dependent oxidoreductase-like protein protein